MSTPTDLIDLHQAARLLGPDPIGIAGLIDTGRLNAYTVNGVVRLSRQEIIDLRFRAAGMLPADEAWNASH